MSTLGPTTLVVRSSTPLSADVDGEVVMLDPSSGRYFGLDDIGSRIWQLLEAPISVGSLCGQLVEEYGADPDTCRDDVSGFLTELEDAGLIGRANTEGG